ncbi:MAG: ATP-binding protein [Myxococcales bacterium]|nr:ATP-binding protein [Myxococcales bacterium]
MGLRAQIVLSLSIVFALSFALLGAATLSLSEASTRVEQAQQARLLARVLGATLRSGEKGPALEDALGALAADARVAAVQLHHTDGRSEAHGETRTGRAVEVELGDGARLRLWLRPPPPGQRSSFGRLMALYVGLSGLAVLFLTYVALTYLIVRPLDRLTRSSEQLAAGSPEVAVPVQGAAEAQRLARAFNEMAKQLRAERGALEARLQQLEATTVELETTQRQLIHGEKLASIGRLAAGVAHEIGNPLAAILGLTELLKDPDLDAGRKAEFVDRIHDETERINRIIRQLLDYSRRDADADLLGERAQLHAVVADAVDLVRPQKQSRKVQIEVEVAADLPAVVGSHAQLTQVVLNLLLNALDALAGEGTIEVRAEAIAEGRCRLSVRDSGPGVAAEMLDHLFEPFATTKPVGQGTGLGLAVCHSLVEALGGTIEAANDPDAGARFDVTLKQA